MPSNRDTFNTSCGNANKATVVTGVTHAASEQETLQANKCNVGYTLQNGNFANLDSSTRTANAARFNNWLARLQTAQASIAAAKDTLRNAGGDNAPL